jgi:hypothetical protein
MITIILITAIFLIVNAIPFVRIWSGRWPWDRPTGNVADSPRSDSFHGVFPGSHPFYPIFAGAFKS